MRPNALRPGTKRPHLRPWVALVDGAKHQIDVICSEAKRRGVEIQVICDFVHVLEYLWGAARCFYEETDPAGEAFVAAKGLAVLEGKAGIVAGSIRRKATALGLDEQRRKKADECASYLQHKQRYSTTRLPSPKGGRSPPACDRGSLCPSCPGPLRHHRGALGTRGSRGAAEAPGSAGERRLGGVLAPPSGSGTPARPRLSLSGRGHPRDGVISPSRGAAPKRNCSAPPGTGRSPGRVEPLAVRQGGQPLSEAVQAALDHPTVTVVPECADSPPTLLEVLVSAIEVVQLAIALTEVEVQRRMRVITGSASLTALPS